MTRCCLSRPQIDALREAHRACGPADIMSCRRSRRIPNRTSLPERPSMTEFAFTSSTCVAVVNPPAVSFDV